MHHAAVLLCVVSLQVMTDQLCTTRGCSLKCWSTAVDTDHGSALFECSLGLKPLDMRRLWLSLLLLPGVQVESELEGRESAVAALQAEVREGGGMQGLRAGEKGVSAHFARAP